jgi:cAMP-dependent protein kinase regulator
LVESDRLRDKVKYLEERAEQEDAYDSDKPASSDVSEEEDFVEDIPDVLVQKNTKFRTSVSAEAFGVFNKKIKYVLRVIPKENETKERIRERLSESFMFASLDEKEMQIVLDAMEVKEYSSGDSVIIQGDDGAELFLVGEGVLE